MTQESRSEENEAGNKDEERSGGAAERPGWLVWLYLVPVYVLLAYPLARWARRINSGDINLNAAQKRDFSSSIEVQDEEPPAPEPVVQGSQLSPYGRIKNMLPVYTGAAPGSVASRSGPISMQDAADKAGEIGKSAAGGATAGAALKWTILGASRGALSEMLVAAVEKPSVIKAIFNNQIVQDSFLNRPTVKSVLDSPGSLMKFATSNKMAVNFLTNPVVLKAMGNKAVVEAVAESGMLARLLETPSVQALASDPNAVMKIIDSNPAYMAAISNPNIHEAIMANSVTAPLLMSIETLQQSRAAQQQQQNDAQPQDPQQQQQNFRPFRN